MNKIKCYIGHPFEYRAYKLNSGDELYFDTVAVKNLGYEYELTLGQTICIYPENNSIIAKGIRLKVKEICCTKKYPNKKWWQFWIKQEKYINGYILMVL